MTSFHSSVSCHMTFYWLQEHVVHFITCIVLQYSTWGSTGERLWKPTSPMTSSDTTTRRPWKSGSECSLHSIFGPVGEEWVCFDELYSITVALLFLDYALHVFPSRCYLYWKPCWGLYGLLLDLDKSCHLFFSEQLNGSESPGRPPTIFLFLGLMLAARPTGIILVISII